MPVAPLTETCAKAAQRVAQAFRPARRVRARLQSCRQRPPSSRL